jgi:hypothetical protein
MAQPAIMDNNPMLQFPQDFLWEMQSKENANYHVATGSCLPN